MTATWLGHRIVWCRSARVHEGHSRFNKDTHETTWCDGTDQDLADALAYEREWSQTYDDD